MKKLLPLLLLLFVCSSVSAQQAILNVDKTDGTLLQYATSDIDSITYTVIPNVLPEVADFSNDIPSSSTSGNIGGINASDTDGTITHYAISLTPSGLFIVDSVYGNIWIVNGTDLTPYEGQTVSGTSTVTDNGGGQASGTVTINIVP